MTRILAVWIVMYMYETFKNCHVIDEDGHVTSAYDIALMSKELLNNVEQTINIDENLSAPIAQGQKLGNFIYIYANFIIFDVSFKF